MKNLINKHNLNLAVQCVMVLAASQLFISFASAEEIADIKARLATIEKNLDQIVEGESKASADISSDCRKYHGWPGVPA